MVRATPTAWGAAGLVLAAAVVAVWTGNNLAYALLAVGLSGIIVDVVVGAMHLRGVHVVRRLPEELYAGHEARGRILVRNSGRIAACGLRIAEQDRETAVVAIARIDPAAEVSLDAGWRLDERGMTDLTGVTIASRWPFGLFERVIIRSLPAHVLVYPRPLGGGDRTGTGLPGDADTSDPRPGDGDFAGLRPYHAGDPPRSIHWPTSARLGEPMIITRCGAGAERCMVRVDPKAQAFERELSRACGEVLRGFQRGAAVGLTAPSGRWEPQSGSAWRRVLLGVLARESHR